MCFACILLISQVFKKTKKPLECELLWLICIVITRDLEACWDFGMMKCS